MRTETAARYEAGQVAAAAGAAAEGSCKPAAAGRRRLQQSRSVAATATVVVGLAVAAAVAGFPRADGFFAAPTASLAGVGDRRALGRAGGYASAAACTRRSSAACPGRGPGRDGGVQAVRMTSEAESAGSGQEGDKPQFVPTKEMTTSTKEILPPPDREAAMKMVAEREAKEMEMANSGMEDSSYNSADIQDLPKPPYYFKTPGEFGNNTLCTDPAWHRALLAFKWLGLPFEVQYDDEEEEAIMVMGDEEYDEPDELLAGLPERVLLSDFVESQEPITNAIAKLEPAWKALHFNSVGKTDLDTDEKRLNNCLEKIENILKKHGPKRGPFVEGDDLTVGDLTLAVTTYHMQAAFAIEKQWAMPDSAKKLKAHMKLFHGMQMFEQEASSVGLKLFINATKLL
eukprot:g5327.t1